jgi:iron complex outermembrane receptor protein
VEVVRGPGAVAYGSDAFGGVIRAVSRTHHPGDPARARWGLSAADDGGAHSGFAEAGFNGLGGGLLVGVHARESDDYSSPRGVVFDSGAETRGARLAYESALGGGVLRVLARVDEGRDIGKPAIDSTVTRSYYPTEDSSRLTVTFERFGSGEWSRLAATAFWSDYRLVTNRERLPAEDVTRRIDQSDVDANDYGVRLDAERRFDAGRAFFGVDISGRFDLTALDNVFDFDVEDRLVAAASAVSIANARRDDWGAFGGASWTRERWSVDGGVRADRVVSKSMEGVLGDHRESHDSFSGFVAASWQAAPGLSATAQASTGFREPLLSDRYFVGTTGRGRIIGNPALDPETSRQFDLALRYSRGAAKVAGFAYLYRIRDLIERYDDGDVYRFRNRGEAEIRGFELEGEVPLPREHVLQCGLHVVRGDLRDDDSALADIPADSLFLTLRRDPARDWWWLVRLAAHRRDDRPGPTEITTPGYSVVDAGVGVRAGRALEFQLTVRNVFDHAYPTDPDEKATLAPGRTFWLTLHGRVD